MYNIFAKIIKTFEICKQFSENLVNESEKVQPKGAAYLRDSRVVKKITKQNWPNLDNSIKIIFCYICKAVPSIVVKISR